MESFKVEFKERQNGKLAYVFLQTSPYNTVTGNQLYELRDLLWNLSEKVNLIVLTSNNEKYYCNGLDPVYLLNASVQDRMKTIEIMIQIIYDLYDLPVPYIAEFTGHAMAGGLVVSAPAEYRFMLNGEFLTGFSEIPVGLFLPSIYMEVVKDYVTPRYLRDIFEGKMFTPKEALEIGLVDGVANSREDLRKLVLEKADYLLSLPKKAYIESRLKARKLKKDNLKRFLEKDKEILKPEVMEKDVPIVMKGIIDKVINKKK